MTSATDLDPPAAQCTSKRPPATYFYGPTHEPQSSGDVNGERFPRVVRQEQLMVDELALERRLEFLATHEDVRHPSRKQLDALAGKENVRQ
jgi:hypothetical protein